MFREKGKAGVYLVRESAHQPGSYVLSVQTTEQVAHIMIHGKPNGMFDVGGGHEFHSLKDLIEFYTNSPLVDRNGGLVTLEQVGLVLCVCARICIPWISARKMVAVVNRAVGRITSLCSSN